jgi:tRNA threonylcarbamoyladenosine biosynthesis protein TsaB
MAETPKITMAIESAIAGGSLSLFSGGSEVDSWTGSGSVSRAEDLMPNLADMLVRNKIDRSEIETVVVSLGPGSFTGIRIGMATAFGLRDSLGSSCVAVSALQTLAFASGLDGTVVAAVPMGRSAIAYQAFAVAKGIRPVRLSDPFASKEPVASAVEGIDFDSFVVHDSIFDIVSSGLEGKEVRRPGASIATLAARSYDILGLEPPFEPIFLSLPTN